MFLFWRHLHALKRAPSLAIMYNNKHTQKQPMVEETKQVPKACKLFSVSATLCVHERDIKYLSLDVART